MNQTTPIQQAHVPWNKGKLVGQKLPLKLSEIWAIRIRLQLAKRVRDLALFNLAIDSKLRSCDLVKLNNVISHMATVLPQEQLLCNKKHIVRYNLKLQNELVQHWRSGLTMPV